MYLDQIWRCWTGKRFASSKRIILWDFVGCIVCFETVESLVLLTSFGCEAFLCAEIICTLFHQVYVLVRYWCLTLSNSNSDVHIRASLRHQAFVDLQIVFVQLRRQYFCIDVSFEMFAFLFRFTVGDYNSFQVAFWFVLGTELRDSTFNIFLNISLFSLNSMSLNFLNCAFLSIFRHQVTFSNRFGCNQIFYIKRKTLRNLLCFILNVESVEGDFRYICPLLQLRLKNLRQLKTLALLQAQPWRIFQCLVLILFSREFFFLVYFFS